MSPSRALDPPGPLVSFEDMSIPVIGRPSRGRGALRRRLAAALAALPLLAARPLLAPLLLAALPLLAACAISPEQRAATERAWAQRDAERAAECGQRGGRYISSSCLQGGAP